MGYVIFEDAGRFDLQPFTFTRPVYDLRCGLLTAAERWQKTLEAPVKGYAFDYLGAHFEQSAAPGDIWINGRLIPDEDLLSLIRHTAPGEYTLSAQGTLLTACLPEMPRAFSGLVTTEWLEHMGLKAVATGLTPVMFSQLPDLFRHAAHCIRTDFSLLTQEGASQPIKDPYTRIYGADNIYVSEGVNIKAAVINAEDGPIYFGKGVTISEGALIHGTHGFGPYATVQMGAKLRGDSAFGPYVKVGGEIGNSVIMGNSNKGHEGYLGNSVLGYWCNIGADTNNSNLKNNYDEVKLWHYPTGRFRATGLQFCGLMMADHAKCGINTMFNTGTVVGVSANVFGAGFPRNFVPDFSWGGAASMTTYALEKALDTANRVMIRRNLQLTEGERAIMKYVFDQTAKFRP